MNIQNTTRADGDMDNLWSKEDTTSSPLPAAQPDSLQAIAVTDRADHEGLTRNNAERACKTRADGEINK